MSIARQFKANILKQQPQEKIIMPEKKISTALTESMIDLKERLTTDLGILKQLSGDEERNPYKQELIEKYKPLVQQIMSSHQNWARQNALFWWLMWRIDVEPFMSVVDDLKSAVEHGLTTPQEFKRDWQTIYLDQVFQHFDQALKKEDLNNLHILQDAIASIRQGKIVTNVPLKAKLYALNGKFAHKTKDFETAQKNYKQAINLDEKSGVKRLLSEVTEKLESEQGERK